MTFTADQVRDMQRRTEGTLNEMLGAYAALLEASAWRDISTAPKDGTWILCWPHHGGANPRPVVLHWADTWSTRHEFAWTDDEYVVGVTHWLPLDVLPAPPTEAGPA